MKSVKTAIVTGANSGIGLETVVGLAERGIRVFMACRNEDKASQALITVQKRVPSAQLEFLKLDLANSKSIEDCASEFRSKSDRLDILVNNAGIMSYSQSAGADGVEVQFKTNHLGHFQLTAFLFSLIPDSANSRVVSLSSIAHKRAKIRFDDLICNDTIEPGAAYSQSKLACLMFAIELDRRLRGAGSKIISVAAHPGVSQTQLFEDTPTYVKAALLFMGPFVTHGSKGAAQPSLHAALNQDVEGGDYFGPQGLMEMSGVTGHAHRSSYSKDVEKAERLWKLSEELTGIQFKF